MKQSVEDILDTLNIYEKQELLRHLIEETIYHHNTMSINLNNIDGYVFGMINNSESNNLNELTMRQLASIKKLSNEGDRDD